MLISNSLSEVVVGGPSKKKTIPTISNLLHVFVSNQNVSALAHGRFTSPRHGYDWNKFSSQKSESWIVEMTNVVLFSARGLESTPLVQCSTYLLSIMKNHPLLGRNRYINIYFIVEQLVN